MSGRKDDGVAVVGCLTMLFSLFGIAWACFLGWLLWTLAEWLVAK